MTRKPLRKRSKSKPGVPSIAVLDDLFSRFIRTRANHECQAWGYRGLQCSSQMQCAHLKSRRFVCLRWHESNAVCLCAAHHAHFHDHADHFYEFVNDTFGPGHWEHLQRLWLIGAKVTNDEKRALVEKFRAYLREAA